MPDHDIVVGSASLYRSILETFEVESDRRQPTTRLRASERRENVMKGLFLSHYTAAMNTGNTGKIMLRFGANHLNRGYDRRGVSTLGNFVAEFAFSRGLRSFNVTAFAAGGQTWWGGALHDADQTREDAAFALLASIASYPATVIDLRPLRQPLHRLTEAQRTPALTSLTYWADAYDAIICYRSVTPIRSR